jgi:hypothetical protein
LRERRVVAALVTSFTIATAAMGLLNAALPAFFLQMLGDHSGYGYAIAAIAAGLLAGEFLVSAVDGEAIARRAVGLGFVAAGALLLLASVAPMRSTTYLILFFVGAGDGATEVVYDTLLQLHLPKRVRGAAFGLASAIQNAGMIVGIASAPLFLAVVGAPTVVRYAGGGCLAAAALALAGMLTGEKRVRTPIAAVPAVTQVVTEELAHPVREESAPLVHLEPKLEPVSYNLHALERLVRARTVLPAEERVAMQAYLFHLRPFAAFDGTLPSWASDLVADAFASVLTRGAGAADGSSALAAVA